MKRSKAINQNSGFTLIELTMVLVIVAAIGIVTLPRLFERDLFDEYGFAEELTAAVRYAQRFAVASGCEVQVRMQPNSYTLWQRADSCSSGTFTRAVMHPAQGGTFAADAPASVTITSSPSIFTFDAMGRSSSDVDIRVGSRQIQIVAQTGLVLSP